MLFSMRHCRRFALPALALSLPLASATAHASDAYETGDVCVQHYAPGASCTANDVYVEDVVVTQILEDCHGPGDTATVRLDVSIGIAASPGRYDVGIFLAADGGSALSGQNCYHDYLAPPLTTTPTYTPSTTDSKYEILNGPWWDGDSDSCGDIQLMHNDASTRVITTLPSPSTSLTLACADENNDGTVDVDICTTWDNLLTNDCNDVTGAFPSTIAKCQCAGRRELLGLLVGQPTTTVPGATTTLPNATTTTLPPSAGTPIPAKIVAIKPGRLFKIIATGEFPIPTDDPTVEGATLSFSTTTGGQTYALPPACWKGDPSKGYSCRDEVCRSVKVKPKLIKAVCKTDTGTFAVPNDGDVEVSLTAGDASLYCAACGGTAAGNPESGYIRKACAAPAGCP